MANIVFAALLRADSEAIVQSVDPVERGFYELEINRGGLDLAHLGDKLLLILQEELNVDVVGWLVPEETDEDLEDLGKGVWAVILQDFVRVLQEFRSHSQLRGSAAGLEALGSVFLGVLDLKLALLIHDFLVEVIDGLLVFLPGSLLGLKVGLELGLLSLDLARLGSNVVFDRLGLVPVLGLELDRVVHGLLALVALLLNELQKLFLGHVLQAGLPASEVWV